MIVSMTD